MNRKLNLREAAAETTQTAAERGAAALEAAIEALMPLLEQAAERLAPLAEDAKDLAKDAKKKSAKFAADTVDAWQPNINEALDRVAPAVESAQKRVQDDLIPKLADLLHHAADLPIVHDAGEIAKDVGERGHATIAALKGELELPKKTSAGKRVVQFAAMSALVAGIAVAVKTFLGTKDTGWSAHSPSPAYTYTDSTTAADEKAEGRFDNEGGVYLPDDSVDTEDAEIVGEDVVTDVVDVAEDVSGDEGEVSTSATGEAANYGDGSYIGDTPPEGYAIKGNERSMKYHTTESGGYDRTIADVWFADEDAATRAGFIRAQR